MAKKKMSVNEFWAILEEAGISKEVFGYEGIINMLSAYEQREAEENRKFRGLETIVNASVKRAEILYTALDKRGFYDDCKVKATKKEASANV